MTVDIELAGADIELVGEDDGPAEDPGEPDQFGVADYWKLRLEHTLQFTQQSTRLIYAVNGAMHRSARSIPKIATTSKEPLPRRRAEGISFRVEVPRT